MEKTVIIEVAHNLIFEDSSASSSSSTTDEECVENQRKIIKKIKAKRSEVVEIPMPDFDDKTFKEHFRIDRSVFQILYDEINTVTISGYGPGREPVSAEKQLMITLWYLGNAESMRSISGRFGVCISSVWHIIACCCGAIIKLNRKKRYVKWPTLSEAATTAAHYKRETRFRGIMGSIDSTHIHIRTPVKYRNNYLNKKGIYTIQLLGVCNHKLEFMYCYTGEPGSISNAALLEKSELITKIDAGDFEMNDNFHLLGNNAGYPLMQWLLTPYPNNANLTEDQELFNNIHARCSFAIKKSFGLLKGRFRRLHFIDSLKPESIVKYIIAACILHNICLRHNDLEEDYIPDKNSLDEMQIEDEINLNYDSLAQQKRNNVLSSLFQYK